MITYNVCYSGRLTIRRRVCVFGSVLYLNQMRSRDNIYHWSPLFNFPTKLNKYSLTGTDSSNTCLGLGDWNQEGQRMSVTLVDRSMKNLIQRKPWDRYLKRPTREIILSCIQLCQLFFIQSVADMGRSLKRSLSFNQIVKFFYLGNF